MAKNHLSLEVIIPTFNGEKTIRDTIRSLQGQSFPHFTVLVHDDCSSDDTARVVREMNDPRIRFEKNKTNLTCQKNLETARLKTKADIVYWLCQDDILHKDALKMTYDAFVSHPEVGAVVRPYFWFDGAIEKPVRAISRVSETRDEVITVEDSFHRIKLFFDAVAQLSGLAYRRAHFELPFHEDIFPGHAYPFASILKARPVVFLREYTVAVRITSSQSRTVSSIYQKSPIQSWVEMFETVFSGARFTALRHYFIHDFVAINYLGLLQIRNYSTFSHFMREVKMLLRYRPQNILSPFFWGVFLFCLITPPLIIIRFVDWYKRIFLARVLPTISFRYRLGGKNTAKLR